MGVVALRVEVHADGVSRQQVETAIQAGLAAALGGNMTTIEIKDAAEEVQHG